MDVAIRHSPSFAAAPITLAPDEQIRAESGETGGASGAAGALGGFLGR